MASTRFLAPLLLLLVSGAAAAHVETKLYATSPRAMTILGQDMQDYTGDHFVFNGAIPWYPYSVDVGVGTPAQTQSMALTVQHGESWVLWSEHCLPRDDINPNRTSYYRNCSSGSFDDVKSSSFAYNETGRYYGSFASGREAGVDGFVMQDTVHIGGAEWSNTTMGLGTWAELDTGFFGLGRPWLYPNGQNATGSGQATMLDQMVAHRVIDSPAFSIYADNRLLLNSTTGGGGEATRREIGSILFGAVDRSKYDGPLKRIQASYGRDKVSGSSWERAPGYFANVTGFWTRDAAGKDRPVGTRGSQIYAAVNPTFAISNLPSDVAAELYRAVGSVAYLAYVNLKAVLCDRIPDLRGSFGVELGGAGGYRLEVPLRDLVVPPEAFHMVLKGRWDGSEGEKYCLLAVQEEARRNQYYRYDYQNSGPEWVIGSMMLRGTYAVFDSENMEVSLAPLKAGGGGRAADIVAFGSAGAHAPDSEFVGYEECFVKSCQKKEDEDEKNGGLRVDVQTGLLVSSALAALGFILVG
ncbi:uncharacterized protein E0L32_012178 [Thyridium curvatum]|uniref:Peptidase A1 domain-containing protein n=1 Tax=Thyridium curvatum TaxID=1093900 RepID=A0A507BIV0_9PEZI|nr:uncharacterized protein E0L32_012178 [Thyridium curvatum]TPX17349.1 hypothetical protein E0L32_012178 [Thyridium curvatum]